MLDIEFMMDHHRDGQTNAGRLVVICQGASSAPHLLLAKVQGYSFQLVFQLHSPSRVHLAASLLLCPAGCFQETMLGGDLSLDQGRLEM